jgi:histone H3/H4
MSNLELPTSIVTRLVKDATSDQLATLISKDVKKAFSQMAGYYALYLYSISNDIAKESRRKKVTESDVYQALKETGFEKHIE